MVWISSAIGLIGLICGIIAVQINKKGKVLMFQIFANIAYALQYVVLGAFSGAVVSIFTMFRCYIYYWYDKKQKKISIPVLVIFIILMIVIGGLSFNGAISLIPIVVAVIETYSLWQNNLKVFRALTLISCLGWLIYNICVLAYVGIIATVIEIVSAIIAIIRYDIKKI